MCGENLLILIGDVDGLRITPACAGKTTSHWFIYFLTKDHPRMCGENLALPAGKRTIVGSPPHVRGKLE